MQLTANDIMVNFKSFIEDELIEFLRREGLEPDINDPAKVEELQRRGQWVSYQSNGDVKFPPGNQGFQWDQQEALMFYVDRIQWPKVFFVCKYADGTERRAELVPADESE
ncbi:hypothetical protein [uncultured Amphritea sp.]|uniref:hypothetical protein n=1 Tax=uncultured Amphritea sp. TaxID=981605 RepID=UPI002624B6CB|nr:hypothetical protein [uncultured Amphritea sp.]